MNWLTDPIVEHFELIATFGLLVVIILLGFIAWQLCLSHRASQELEISFGSRYEIDQLITDTLTKVGSAIQHHAQVSAVLGLMEQLDTKPDALELIKSYPEMVRAAAWLHYIDTLGAALQTEQKKLKDYHRDYGANHLYAQNVQRSIDAIRAKLDGAVKAAGQTRLRSV